jgi:DNA-binding response OmpR family regulator
MPTPRRSAVILLVEDDANDVFFLERAFKKADVKVPVRVARDGQEAIDYLSHSGIYQDRVQNPDPCLLIIDLTLPKKNGLEVLHWLRHQSQLQDLPVVMVTSLGETGMRDRAMNEGVEAFRVKPMSLEELVQFACEIRLEVEVHCKDASPCPPSTGSAI